jgi:hypothetical protein
MLLKKEYIFLVPSFWNILFFCLFQFLKSLKKIKRMLHYKGGTSVARKHTSSKTKEHTDA